MLVTFHTKAYGDVTMFGDIAVRLLKLMGHSGAVPSAIGPQDIPAALEKLKRAVAADEATRAQAGPQDSRQGKDDDDKEHPVSLKNRAFPLLQMLEAASRSNVPVMCPVW